jgi:hypothetical protein
MALTPYNMVYNLFGVYLVFQLNYDQSVYIWYGGILFVFLVALFLNIPAKTRWYLNLESDVLIKFVDVFKVAVILFLFLQPLSVVDYSCKLPPAGWSLIGSFVESSLAWNCNSNFWNSTTPVATVLNPSQADIVFVICNTQKFSNRLWDYYTVLVIVELATLFFFYVNQKRIGVSVPLLVTSVVFEFLLCGFWGCLEIFSRIMFTDNNYWCTISIGFVPIRAFACIHMGIGFCFLIKVIFSKIYPVSPGVAGPVNAVPVAANANAVPGGANSSPSVSSGASGGKKPTNSSPSGSNPTSSVPLTKLSTASQFQSSSTPLNSGSSVTPPGTP